MCGISGILSLDGRPINNLGSKIDLMTKLLNHRGPDQSGTFISEKKNFGLSNNRLSIVSPKEILKLPYSKNNNDFLSFNGEIYNYLDLKGELIKEGINFQTSTDTEVLYEYLKKNNQTNFNKINGMWSFAFYNQKKMNYSLAEIYWGRDICFIQ